MKEFIFTNYQYDLIINNMKFDIKKQEKVIMEMLYKGYTNEKIAKLTKLSTRTICRRKKDLLNKITFFLNEREDIKESYYVYIHKFPNNKVYIGMTSDINKRWNNGLGYKDNERMFNDILIYGWNNIKHSIIANNLTYFEALNLENEMIIKYNSYNKEKGYNIKVIK